MSGWNRRLLLKLAATGLVAALGWSAPVLAKAADAPWTIQAAEHPVSGSPAITETVWSIARPPGGPNDRIAVHRYRAKGASIATLLYLPGTNMNGALALTDEAHNLWLYLAARGIEVYALDYRTHVVPAGADSKTFDFMKAWTTAAFVADAQSAGALAARESGHDKIFVAGFSRGAYLTYAVAAADPAPIAGLVILDGPFKSPNPKPVDAAKAMADFEAAGTWSSDVGGSMGWDARQALMAAVIANPGAPATDAKFKTIGEQLTYVLQNAWGPGALANPAGGVSKIQVLATLMHDYDRFYPAIQDVEGKVISAEPDAPSTRVDDSWGEWTLPILAFANTNMGPEWLANAEYSATASGSKDVTVVKLKDYGHLDVLVSETAVADVFEPTAAWIKARATKP